MNPSSAPNSWDDRGYLDVAVCRRYDRRSRAVLGLRHSIICALIRRTHCDGLSIERYVARCAVTITRAGSQRMVPIERRAFTRIHRRGKS